MDADTVNKLQATYEAARKRFVQIETDARWLALKAAKKAYHDAVDQFDAELDARHAACDVLEAQLKERELHS